MSFDSRSLLTEGQKINGFIQVKPHLKGDFTLDQSSNSMDELSSPIQWSGQFVHKPCGREGEL